MATTITIKPYLRKQFTRDDGTHPVQLIMRMPGEKQAHIPVKNFSIPASCWNQKQAKVSKAFDGKGKTELNAQLNSEIETLKNFLREIEQGKYHWSPSRVKEFYISRVKSGANELSDFIDSLTEKMDADSAKTKYRYQYVKSLVFEFDRSVVKMNALTYSFVQNFEDWMKRTGRDVNTRKNYHSILKCVINTWNREFYEQPARCIPNPYSIFKIKKKVSVKEYLTLEELRLIRGVELSDEKLILHRDRFFFAFFAGGLSFTDCFHMSDDNFIHPGYWTYKRRKNRKKDGCQITRNILCNRANEILKKYKERPFMLGYNGSRYNLRIVEDYIVTGKRTGKEIHIELQKDHYRDGQAETHSNNISAIAKIAGVNRRVTSKMIRNTWANLAMNAGVSIELVSVIMGHKIPGASDITLGYAGRFNQQVIDEAVLKVANLI